MCLDPARVPERPFSPNLIVITGAARRAGSRSGFASSGFFEYRDSSFGVGDDVVRLCQLPVLASVPLMMTGDDKRAGWRRAALVNVAGTFMRCSFRRP